MISLDVRPDRMREAGIYAAAGVAALALAGVASAGGASALLLVVVLIVGGTVLFVCTVRSEWAVALIVFMIFTRLASTAGADNTAPAAIALFCGAATLASHWGRHRPEILSPFVGLAAFYLSLGLLSSVWAASPAAVYAATQDRAFTVAMAVGLVACVTSMRHLRWAAWALIGAGLLVGLLATRQYLTADWSTDVLGMTKASVQQIVGESNDYRAGGPFKDANFFGQTMVVVLALSIERATAAVSKLWRLVAAFTAATAAFTILITYSRGALVAAVVVVGMAVIRSRNPLRVLAIGVVCGAVLLLVAPANYSQRLMELPAAVGIGAQSESTPIDPAIEGRSSSWRVAEQMFLEHPVGGVGLGNYKPNYLDYSAQLGMDHRGIPRSAHSYPLQVLAEGGLTGLFAMVLFLGGAFVSLSRSRRTLLGRGEPPEAASLLRGLRDGLIGYLIAGIFLHDAYPQLLWVLIALGWASVQAVYQREPGAPVLAGGPGLAASRRFSG